MDDRTWYLAGGTLVAAVLVTLVDAAVTSFDAGPGFWAVLTAMLTFLGGRAAFLGRKDDRNGG